MLPSENAYYNETVYFAECIRKGCAPTAFPRARRRRPSAIALAEMASADAHGKIVNV